MSDESNQNVGSFPWEGFWEQEAQRTRLDFGEQVRRARTEKNMSQAELAQKMNRRQAYISEIENGKAEPSITTIMQLRIILKKQVAYFFPSNWHFDEQPQLNMGELTPGETELIQKLRELETGFRQHLALRILNAMADVEKEEEDYTDRAMSVGGGA